MTAFSMPNHDSSIRKLLGEAIDFLESQVPDPHVGLPEEIFLFVSRLTPLVNVDLLIRNTEGHVLLTWRDDPLFGQGWHVPGGIVRLGESFATRISAVAAGELGANVTFQPEPLGIFESVEPTRDSRTHHVSLLFDCRLTGEPDPMRMFNGDSAAAGAWAWHKGCPDGFLQSEYLRMIS